MDPNDPSLPPPNELIHHHFPEGLDEFGQPIKGNFEGVHASEERTANRELFSLELEFVQALASPFYLYNLAVEGYLDDPVFLNYLKYLGYWKEKEYARFIMYPQALHHLDLLQHQNFRNAVKRQETQTFLNHYQFEHWRTWRVKSRPPILDGADSAGLADSAATAAQQPAQAGEAAAGPSDQTPAQPVP
ncbi:suppressor of hpr1 [Tulasnella sp. UAMH 9824]|nr:suppressor of hpr1 [Tulasnella sp. UAMH 9824]